MGQEPINENNSKQTPAVKPRLNQPLITTFIWQDSHQLLDVEYPWYRWRYQEGKLIKNLDPQKPIFLFNLACRSRILSRPGRICQRFYPRPWWLGSSCSSCEDVIGDELGAFNKSSNAGTSSSLELVIFISLQVQLQELPRRVINLGRHRCCPAYHLIKRPVIDAPDIEDIDVKCICFLDSKHDNVGRST